MNFFLVNIMNRGRLRRILFTLKVCTRKLSRSIWSLIVLLVFFTFSFFSYTPLLPPSFLSDLNSFIYLFINSLVYGGNGFEDGNVREVIFRLTNSFGFILSVLSAIYVFTYREQKSVSPSASNTTYKNHFVLKVVFIIIFIMITGYALVNNFDGYAHLDQYNDSLMITNMLITKIIFWMIGLIFSVVYFCIIIKYLMGTMNVANMLKNSIKITADKIEMLTKMESFFGIKSLRKNIYINLHYNIESVFQNLKFTSQNNMNKDFEESIDRFNDEVINKLKQSDYKFGVRHPASHLLETDKEDFIDVYNSLLRNVLSLINHLYTKKHYNKGKRLVSLYFSLYFVGEETLRRYFMLSLNEFLDSLNLDDSRQLSAFQNELKSISTDQTLSVYRNLLMKLIMQNNVKVLTNVVYDFKENALNREKNSVNYKGIGLKKEANRGLRISGINILLQCLLKSIEIGHYPSTGFLVKYLITNFKGTELNEVLQIFRKDPFLFSDVFEKEINSDESDYDIIKINKETFSYCSEKLSVLLYGQQVFAYKEKLWFTEDTNLSDQEIDIASVFDKSKNPNYILNKVTEASSLYGLLFFKDNEVMKNVKAMISQHQYPDYTKL